MSTFSDEDLLMLSGIQHFAFCRRQWALIHLEQVWQENLLTFGGRELHEKADDPFTTELRGTVLTTRSLPLVSRRLGLYGVADVVEFHRDDAGIALKGRSGCWRPHPVEYKHGKPKPDDRDRVQLCAQALCLEEMFGVTLAEGDMFYGKTRRRERVEFDSDLRALVCELALQMHEAFRLGTTPPPEHTPACQNCSLVELCLPQLGSKRRVGSYLADALRKVEAEGGE